MKTDKLSDKKQQNKKIITIVCFGLMVCFLVYFFVIRCIHLTPGWGTIVDPYGFYVSAVAEMHKNIPRLSSGLAYAYTENLSMALTILHYRKWFISV